MAIPSMMMILPSGTVLLRQSPPLLSMISRRAALLVFARAPSALASGNDTGPSENDRMSRRSIFLLWPIISSLAKSLFDGLSFYLVCKCFQVLHFDRREYILKRGNKAFFHEFHHSMFSFVFSYYDIVRNLCICDYTRRCAYQCILVRIKRIDRLDGGDNVHDIILIRSLIWFYLDILDHAVQESFLPSSRIALQ